MTVVGEFTPDELKPINAALRFGEDLLPAPGSVIWWDFPGFPGVTMYRVGSVWVDAYGQEKLGVHFYDPRDPDGVWELDVLQVTVSLPTFYQFHSGRPLYHCEALP